MSPAVMQVLQPVLVQPGLDVLQSLCQLEGLLFQDFIRQHSCLHRATHLVAQHEQDLDLEVMNCELQRRQGRGVQAIARHADHEDVAQALVEDNLGGHTRIRAPQDSNGRELLRDEGPSLEGAPLGPPGHVHPEARVASLERLKDLCRRPREGLGLTLVRMEQRLLHGEALPALVRLVLLLHGIRLRRPRCHIALRLPPADRGFVVRLARPGRGLRECHDCLARPGRGVPAPVD
mmetsp:Transcript_94405/g.254041  ORF Transcript_94405/g.254041 Transcript_94405/m.254041 type:complete len:234 (-) Transcript_94405:197-898(-)